MNYLITFLIFCLVLFLYLHICFHLKTSNDLEIYTIERPSKNKLEEICDLRQPVMFKFINEDLTTNCTLNRFNKNYNAFDIKIRDISDINNNKNELYLPLQLNESIHLFRGDKEGKYITENNMDFLEETGIVKMYRYNDLFLRPFLVSKCMYDFLSGSQHSHTPLRYSLNYRNYFYVTSGRIKIKLIPPSSTKYLYSQTDYDNFDFYSLVNPWNIQEEYKCEFNKVKTLELSLKKNDIIFVPPYWWYSLFYVERGEICSFQYRTYMNTITILPQIMLHMLQGQNTKYEMVQKWTKNFHEAKLVEPSSDAL